MREVTENISEPLFGAVYGRFPSTDWPRDQTKLIHKKHEFPEALEDVQPPDPLESLGFPRSSTSIQGEWEGDLDSVCPAGDKLHVPVLGTG